MNIFVSTLPFVYMQAQTGLLVFHCLVPVKKSSVQIPGQFKSYLHTEYFRRWTFPDTLNKI